MSGGFKKALPVKTSLNLASSTTRVTMNSPSSRFAFGSTSVSANGTRANTSFMLALLMPVGEQDAIEHRSQDTKVVAQRDRDRKQQGAKSPRFSRLDIQSPLATREWPLLRLFPHYRSALESRQHLIISELNAGPACGQFWSSRLESLPRHRKWIGVPIINLSMGGRYCSITRVDNGKALVLERRIARIATANLDVETRKNLKVTQL